MSIRSAVAGFTSTLAVPLAVPLALVLAVVLVGPVSPTYAAASVCQGRAATIEAAGGTITGTEGDDVIVATGPEADVRALGGNDLVCVVGGTVRTGLGDDSVDATGAAVLTYAYLSSGHDTFAGGAGGSDVTVEELSSFAVTFGGTGFAFLRINPTSTPGTGTVDFGDAGSRLYAFGLERATVNLAAQSVSVDGLLSVRTVGLDNATATGCRVRMRGDAGPNSLEAYGHDVVVSGGDGGDRLGRVGNGFDLDLPRCGRYRSLFRGQGGPDRLYGRLGDDTLLGGPGRDHANGAGGVDTCRVEVRRSCER